MIHTDTESELILRKRKFLKEQSCEKESTIEAMHITQTFLLMQIAALMDRVKELEEKK
jgi:hypothetical protein